jgi:hypothetical protein
MEPKISITRSDYRAIVRAEVVRPIRAELRAWLVPGIGGAVLVAGTQAALGAPFNSVGGVLLFAALSVLGGCLAIGIANAFGASYRVYNRMVGERNDARERADAETTRATDGETEIGSLKGSLLAEKNTHRGDVEQLTARLAEPLALPAGRYVRWFSARSYEGDCTRRGRRRPQRCGIRSRGCQRFINLRSLL